MRRWLLGLVAVATVGAGAGWWIRHNSHQTITGPVKTATAAPLLPASAQNWPVYSNSKYGFSVRYPAGWHDLGSLTPSSELPKVYSNQTSLASTDPKTVALIVDSAAGTSPTQCYPKLTDARYQYTQSPVTMIAGNMNGTKYLLDPSPTAQQQPQYGVGFLVIRQGRCYDVSVITGSASVRDEVSATAETVAETIRFL